MLEYKKSELEKIKSDYSIYHPNNHQFSIMYSISRQFAQEFELEPDILRFIMIKASIRFQIETKNFMYEHIYEVPAFRLTNTNVAMDYAKELILEMIDNPSHEDEKRVSEIFERLMQYYIDEFAGKKYSTD